MHAVVQNASDLNTHMPFDRHKAWPLVYSIFKQKSYQFANITNLVQSIPMSQSSKVAPVANVAKLIKNTLVHQIPWFL